MTGSGRVFVGLGGNLGTRAEIRARFDDACERLRNCAASDIDRSPLYVSGPVGPVTEQPAFLNQVVAFEPADGLTPRGLLEALRAIEADHGRTRAIDQGPRTLDLDLLLFGDQVVCEPDLIVPHPRIGQRAFVMQPLLDLLGQVVERID